MEDVKVRVFRDEKGLKTELPRYMSEHAAGMDVRAAEEITIEPGKTGLVHTGIYLEVPPGFEMQVRPRSGLALKKNIIVPNSPGTIDADYRGEVGVILMNCGDAPFQVRQGDRVAQLVLSKVWRCAWEEKNELNSTARGGGGFGHTGIK